MADFTRVARVENTFEIASDISDGEDEDIDAYDVTDAWYGRVVVSLWFQLLVATAIVLNVFSMAVQADYPHENFRPVNAAFLIFFSLELMLRFRTFGLYEFFCQGKTNKPPSELTEADKLNDWKWNYFDFTVVSVGWVDFVASLLISGQGTNAFVQMIRIFRILRILRVIRLFKTLDKLQLLVKGLMESASIVFWVSTLMCVMILIVAILCTTIVGHQAAMWGDEEQVIYDYFGTVMNSMQTLFQFLTMDDWGMITRLVCKKMPGMYPVFIGYVIFGAMVILSLLTGVMAEHMNSVREAQAEQETLERQAKVKESTRIFYRAFQKADINGDGSCSLESFITLLNDKNVAAQMENTGIDLTNVDLPEIFECMDLEHDKFISWDEFKYGLSELRAGVTPKQVIRLRNKIQQAMNASAEDDSKISKELKDNNLDPADFDEELHRIKSHMQRAIGKLDAMDSNLQDFANVFDD